MLIFFCINDLKLFPINIDGNRVNACVFFLIFFFPQWAETGMSCQMLHLFYAAKAQKMHFHISNLTPTSKLSGYQKSDFQVPGYSRQGEIRGGV